MQPASLPQSLISPFQPILPTQIGQRLIWQQLHGSSLSLAVLEAAKVSTSPMVVVTASERSAQTIENELSFFSDRDPDLPILRFPDWECLPYDRFSPHQDIVSQRLSILYRTSNLKKGIIIISVSNLMQRVSPTNYVLSHSFSIKVGEREDIVALSKKLEQATYRHVSQVVTAGEFAVRGGIVDVFPMGSQRPFRIDFFDDEVESIRYFDPDTQRSGETESEINVLPAREFPLTKEAISQFRSAYRRQFSGDPKKSIVYAEVSRGRAYPGIEFYLPLFFGSLNTLFDFLPDSTCWILEQDCQDTATHFDAEKQERFEYAKLDPEWPVLPPTQLFLDAGQLQRAFNDRMTIELSFSKKDSVQSVVYDVGSPVELKIDYKSSTSHADLINYLENYQGRTLLIAETAGHRENLLGLLADHNQKPTACSSWREFINNGKLKLGIVIAEIERGLRLNTPPLSVITESQLYGEKVLQRRRRNKKTRDPETVIRSLAELNIGDPVVHEELGVGRYCGLQTLSISDDSNEFLSLEYFGGDKLYIPVLSFHLISRYVGASPENAPLHKLGSDAWEKAKKRAAEKVYDIAAELIEVQALRRGRKGNSYPLPEEAYASFVAEFPFEETPDQEQVINDVIEDLTSNKPMDRLVCGDVGFGKTEIALRAAFIAVHNQKQVAVLVPTTLLAQQHYHTFQDRFADFPININLLSRFRSKKEIDQALKTLRDGTCDIIIGTHRLLQKDINFKSLGLLILDEEHRFGVRQKETLKRLRSEVDIVTLTATPIPRSLCMAMGGLRPISIIATPPPGRLSVKTFVRDWSNAQVREACLRELHRGGQIFFLHNEVKTIENMSSKLKDLMPEADIRVAHGQLPERELESIMSDFYHQRFNILLCTSIIESGIDIPSANTIIINRADRFGLAQLHQLRGRVGRSHHQAFAYFFVNSRRDISGDATKRLDAIEALEDLGSGFSLASHDMEIRGAGELLGESQSGMVDEIGFTLYTEYLNRAIKTITANPSLVAGDIAVDTTSNWTEINLHIPTLFLESYLPDVHTRLVMYKRIANALDLEELKELRTEMMDRFGLLPESGNSLFKVMELKLDAIKLGIHKIDIGPKGGRIEFHDKPNIDPMSIINLIQLNPSTYGMGDSMTLKIKIDLESGVERINQLKELLDYFLESNSLVNSE